MAESSSSFQGQVAGAGELGGPLDLSKKILENTQPAHQNSTQLKLSQNQLLLQLQQHFLHHQQHQMNQNQVMMTTTTTTTDSSNPRKVRRAKKTPTRGTKSIAPFDATTTSPIDHNNNNDKYKSFNSAMLNASDSLVSSQNILKAHLCLDCGRSFARSDMLTRHSRLHSGLKPYKCKRCNQIFSRSDHLSTHERTHTGEKPYQCGQCSYSACRRDMITRHMRTHENAINKSNGVNDQIKKKRRKRKKPGCTKMIKTKQSTCKRANVAKNPHGACSEPDQSTSEIMELNGQSPMTTTTTTSNATPRSESMSSSSREFDDDEDEVMVIGGDATTTTTAEKQASRPLDLSKYSPSEAQTTCVAVVNYQISSTS